LPSQWDVTVFFFYPESNTYPEGQGKHGGDTNQGRGDTLVQPEWTFPCNGLLKAVRQTFVLVAGLQSNFEGVKRVLLLDDDTVDVIDDLQ
jgi:hypothetical protein